MLILSDILIKHCHNFHSHGKLGPSQIFKANKIIKFKKKTCEVITLWQKYDCLYRKPNESMDILF